MTKRWTDRADREATIDEAAKLARGAWNYDDEDAVNETRADLGQAAVMVGCFDWHADEDWRAHARDAVANIVHFCHRAGLDPDALMQSALLVAQGDLEDGREAARDEAQFQPEM